MLGTEQWFQQQAEARSSSSLCNAAGITAIRDRTSRSRIRVAVSRASWQVSRNGGVGRAPRREVAPETRVKLSRAASHDAGRDQSPNNEAITVATIEGAAPGLATARHRIYQFLPCYERGPCRARSRINQVRQRTPARAS